MPEFLKRDDALWLRHLRAAGISLPVGQPVVIGVNGFSVDFEPMRPGSHGRLTHGLRASGPNAHHWLELPRGAIVQVELLASKRSKLVLPPSSSVNRSTVPHRAEALPQPLAVSTVPSSGAVVGVDVGYSTSKATTGFCTLLWSQSAVTWDSVNARTDTAHREQTLSRIAPSNRSVLAAAIDGPLLPELASHARYRACEAILSCGVLQKRGKPGQTNAGSGPALHRGATGLANFVLEQLEVGNAVHSCQIHARAIVEAFPNLFLGTLCDERDYPERPGKQRKWTDTLYPLVTGRLRQLLQRLLPAREVSGTWALDDHEEIAGFTCALTALCVAAGQYTAVGSQDDGWIILPPRAFLGAGWERTLTECCARAQRVFPGAGIRW